MATAILAAAAFALALNAQHPAQHEIPVTPPAAQAQAWTPVALTQDSPRWRTQVCAGVSGLSEQNAQFVIDRVAARAEGVGLRIGAPGCTANLLVVFTADPQGQAQAIARERTDPASLTGRNGMTEGLSAYDSFVNSSAPVRWWRVTRSVTDAGVVANRDLRAGEAPRIDVPERGRLASTTFEAFSHVIVIVDLAQVNGQRLDALADYIAMVALSPLRGRSDVEGGSSILGLFSETPAPGAITEADRVYLERVYR